MTTKDALAVADKYIARDGGHPAAAPAAVVWAPIKLAEKEIAWMTKAVLRAGYIPTRERDGDSAPHLSELRSMHQRGLIQGLPWRITKFGRDCLRELEKQQSAPSKVVALRTQEIPVHAVPTLPSIRPLADVEIELIKSAIAQCGGNKTHAARALGISVRTIRNKVNAVVPTHTALRQEI